MRTFGIALLATALLAGSGRDAAAEDLDWEYERLQSLDFLFASTVGMPYRGDWTVRPRGADTAGLTSRLGGLDAGTFVGSGWGLQLTTDAPHGVRLSFATLYHRGVLVDHALPLADISAVDHAEAWIGVGWQHQWDRLSLHTQTVAGLDSTSFDAVATPGGLSQGLGATGMPAGLVRVSRFDARIGQEVGLHVMLGGSVLAFLDAQVDLDGQWHVRFGLGVGGFGPWFRNAGVTGAGSATGSGAFGRRW